MYNSMRFVGKIEKKNGLFLDTTFCAIQNENSTIIYYVNDNTGVSVYDANWNYLYYLYSSIDLTGTMIAVDNHIYIAGYNYEWLLKLDSSLNLVTSVDFADGPPFSQDLIYDPCNKTLLLLVVTSSENAVFVYDLNLNLNSIIILPILSSDHSWAFFYHQNKIVVGTRHGMLYVVDRINPTVNISFRVCGSKVPVDSVFIDTSNNIMITCDSFQYLHLYDINGTHLNSFETNDLQPTFASIDQSGRLIVIDGINNLISKCRL